MDIIGMEDLSVFDAESGVFVAEGCGGVWEDFVKGAEGETVCEIAYCVDVDLEVFVVPLC